MAGKRKTKQKEKAWLVPTVVLVLFAVLIGLLARSILNSSSNPKKQIQVITLIKPPPPEVKEKPPEPEVQKEQPKQTIEQPTEQPTPQNQADQSQDDSPPAGDNLAVDGEGGAGDNAFGLGAKKGGRAITLGGGGGGGTGLGRSALSKYGYYSRTIESDIERKVKKILEKTGGRPKGKFQTTVHITLSPNGTVLKFSIVDESGNERLDQAFRTALTGLKMTTPPPEGMPSSLTFRMTTRG
ncbi:TonB family protein [Geomesophilobacter sediminis]|uniref:TonB family protein n=1 Tax=Geomesophilobacter sediminis TaxID=2798584 RepID=A0A8J7JB42_9BACT|nr:TonB family protein [Geomesophilobacter sediminis]MBJ6724281.1 TonB family protein [Geomesophilobacter sediminis]